MQLCLDRPARLKPDVDMTTNPSYRQPRRINPAKLLHSKWTAVTPQHKERHFLVVKLLDDEETPGTVRQVVLEAVLTRRQWTLPWQVLKDESQWLQGWA